MKKPLFNRSPLFQSPGSGGGGGGGDVTGPSSSTVNAIARWADTEGSVLKNSGVTVDDAGNMVVAGDLTVHGDFDGGGPDLSDDPPQPLGAASSGTSGEAARADHVHAHGSQAGGSLHAVATPEAAGFMSGEDKKKVDAALTAQAFQAKGDLLVGTGAGAFERLAHPGTAGKVVTSTADGLEYADVTGGGPALSDATPEGLGVAASGSSAEASRADHVHAHGDLAGGTLHAVATTDAAGFMSAADKQKLDGLTPGALDEARLYALSLSFSG